jgi:hypothetical protein
VDDFDQQLKKLERMNQRLIALDVIGAIWIEYIEFLSKQFVDERWAVQFAQFHRRVMDKVEGLQRVEWQWEESSFETTAFFDDGTKPMKYELKWYTVTADGIKPGETPGGTSS